MKAMKRQTRSRDSETEQNEVNERKKARLSNESKKKNEENDSSVASDLETNGDSSMPELCPAVLKPSDQKTSTPLLHNGAVGNLAAKFHNATSPEMTPLSSPEAALAEKEQDSKDSPAASEQKNKEEENDIDVDVVSNKVTSDEEKPSVSDCEKSDEELAEEFLEEKSASNGISASSEAKLDVDLFLSSLLQPYELEGHADSVTAVAADGDIIVSASMDTTIKLWDPLKKQELRNFQGHTGSVTSIVLLSAEQSSAISAKMGFPDDTRIVISGSTDCSIRLWSVYDGLELLSIYTYNGITSLAFMENNNYIAVGTDGGKLELWDLCFSKILHSVVAHEGCVSDVKVNDCYIYTVSSDGKVKVWLYEDDELQQIYCRSRKSPSPNGEMLPTIWKCLTFYEDRLILGDNTSDIKILEWKAGRISMKKNQIKPNGLTDSVFVKNDVLLTSSFDPHKHVGAINVWQLPNLVYVCTMSGDMGKVNSVSFTSKDGILRVVSGGSKLVVWEYISSKPAAVGEKDRYFCKEVELLGEDSSSESADNSVNSPQAKPATSDAVDGTMRSRKCTFL